MDWILSILIVAGNFMVGKKLKWGWVILCFNSLGWIYYAFTLDPIQYGLVPSAAINFVVCVVNLYKWFRED